MEPRSKEFTFSKTDAALLTKIYRNQFESKEDTEEFQLSHSSHFTLAKNSLLAIDKFNKTAKVEDKKERFAKLIEHSELFSETADHLGAIARMTGSCELGKIAFSIKGIAQIGTALPGLLAGIKAGSLIGMINPACAVISGIAALGLFGSDDNDSAYQEAMFNYLQCIREEMHAGFNLVNENIGIVYDTLRQGIVHLDKIIHQQTEYLDHSITLATHQIENSVFDRADVILRGLQDIHLADVEKTITDVGLMLNNPRKYDFKEKQKAIDSLFHWLVKGIRQPLQNGLNELKTLQSNQVDAHKKIIALITEPADYAKNIALLVGIAKLFSTNEKISNIDVSALINPDHWIYLLGIYCTARSHLTENFDDAQYQIKEIQKVGQHYLSVVKAFRNVEFYECMLKACEKTYKDIQKTFDECAEEINKAINADLKKTDRENKNEQVDLRKSIKDMTKLSIVESCETGSRASDESYGKYVWAYITDNYSAHAALLTPSMRFLIRLELASVSSYVYVHRQCSDDFFWGGSGSGPGEQQFYYSLKEKESDEISTTTYSSIFLNSQFESATCRGILIHKVISGTSKTSKFSSAEEASEKKAIEVFNKNRKAILALFLKSSEKLFIELDSTLMLLKTYCHIVGFKQDEIKQVNSLKSSKDVLKQVTDFSESKEGAELTSLAWAENLKKTKETLLSKITIDGYFDNKHYNEILFLMEFTKKLPDLNQQFAIIQSMQNQQDKASRLDQLMDTYINLIATWNEYYPKKWLEQFRGTISEVFYEKYVAQYDQLEAAYNKLQSELNNEKTTLQIISVTLKTLHQLSHQHHRDLKLISQKYAKSDNKYIITDEETGLISQEQFDALFKQIETPMENKSVNKTETRKAPVAAVPIQPSPVPVKSYLFAATTASTSSALSATITSSTQSLEKKHA